MPKALFTHLIRCNSILNNTPVRASQRPPLEGRRKDFKRDCHILLQPSYRKKILTPQFSFSVHTNWKIFVFMQQTGGREGGRNPTAFWLLEKIPFKRKTSAAECLSYWKCTETTVQHTPWQNAYSSEKQVHLIF